MTPDRDRDASIAHDGPVRLSGPEGDRKLFAPMEPSPSPSCSRRTWWFASSPELRGLLLVALVFIPSCGSGLDGGGVRSRLQTLVLQAVGEGSENREPRRYRRLYPEPDTPWVKRGASASYEPGPTTLDGGESKRLVLRGADEALLRIPGDFDSRAFNGVALQLSVRQPVALVLAFVQNRQELPFTVLVSPEAREGPQVLRFACPELATVEGPIQMITLRTRGRAGELTIDWLDLFWQAPESLLPSASSGAELVRMGGDARRGVGLVPGQPLEARVENPTGHELAFTFGLPGYFRRPEETPVLAVTLEPAGGEAVVHRLPLRAESTWLRARYPLDSFGDAPLTVTWTLESARAIACVVAEPALIRRAASPRHVLLVTSDTHRADYLGVSGSGVDVRTPTLDALAARGTLFLDAFSSTNVTNPSHIALMTGVHPRDIGILENNERLADAAPTLAEAFKSAGFATYASLSARHLEDRTSGLGQGFDRVSFPERRNARDGALAIREALDWLEESPDVPTFLWVHVFDAHTPYDPPPEFAARYYPAERNAFDPAAPPLEGVPPILEDKEFFGLRDLAYPEAMYRGEVSFLDAELRGLLEAPVMKDAVIAFTADHGESFGEHGIFYNHAGLYPQSIRVPLILVYPGARGGQRVSVPVEHIDLGRTLLDLSGNAAVDFPGRNLTRIADGDTRAEGARFAIGAHGLSASISSNGWHLVLNLHAAHGTSRLVPSVKHAVELYNLENDPDCEVDLLDEELARAHTMRAELVHWLVSAEDLGWRGERRTDAATLRDLEALGYVAGAAEAPPELVFYELGCTCEPCRRFE